MGALWECQRDVVGRPGLAEPGRGPDAAGGPCLVTVVILPILKMFKTQTLTS